MTTLPIVLEQQLAPPRAELRLRVPPELQYLKGHFPDAPVVAGIVQVKWAIELARRYLGAGGELTGMDALKFQRPMRPGAVVTLALEWEESAAKLRFSYRSNDTRFSSGRLLFG